MVFEYMEHGDLTELLRQNDPQCDARETKKITLKQVTIIGKYPVGAVIQLSKIEYYIGFMITDC